MLCEPSVYANAAEIGSFNGVIFFDKEKNKNIDSGDCSKIQDYAELTHISVPLSEVLRKAIIKSAQGKAMKRKQLDFEYINQTALQYSTAILSRWLPDGQLRGNEYIARNPNRNDRIAGSFKINVVSGKWGDFATPNRGNGFISLAAYRGNS